MAQKMSLVRCMVRLRGSLDNVVPPADRGFGTGIVSWPEALMLKHLHEADDCLEGVVRVGYAETSPRDEKARLVHIYGEKAVDELYPGIVPQMEMEMPAGAGDAAAEAEAAARSEAAAMTVPRFVIEEHTAPSAPTLGAALAPVEIPDPEMDGEDETSAADLLDMPDPAVDGGAVTGRRRRAAAVAAV